jgi:hypothetical protein
MSRAIQELENIVKDEKDYITIAEMLDLAHIAEAGSLGIPQSRFKVVGTHALCVC